jgi:hypothetical protein
MSSEISTDNSRATPTSTETSTETSTDRAADLDFVLARVAAGELTPEKALALLGPSSTAPTPPRSTPGDAGTERPSGPPPASPRPPDPPPASASPLGDTVGLRRVLLRTSARSIQIWGDPSVAEISITGEHELHRDGDSMVIENPSGVLTDRPGYYTLASTIVRALPHMASNLVIRVNPSLTLLADLSASSLKVQGPIRSLRVSLLASSLKVHDFVGSLDVDAVSSSVKGELTLVGENQIDCESSSCKLVLSSRSDVAIRARNQLGKVVLPSSGIHRAITEPDVSEVVIGAGRGYLDIDATMSTVMIGTSR